jgi:MFS family permease
VIRPAHTVDRMATTTLTATRPPIVSRALLLRFVSIVCSSISFYLPLAVIPLYAAVIGARAAAGLATAALLVATVACELVTPRMVSHVGYRWALAIGLVLLGAPALLLLAAPSIPVIVAVSAVRGIGFAITTVAGGALTAALVPVERRGEGLAIVGLVTGVPSILALPVGIWAAAQWGYGAVFAVTATAPLIALVTLPGLPHRPAATGSRHGIGSGLRSGALMRPAVIFAASTSAVGVLVTYLPLAVTGRLAWIAPVALFTQPTAATAARWVAGRLGDRRGQARLLVPGVVLSVAGMAAVSLTSSPATVVAAAAAFGAGFGILQNATLSLMYARVPAAGYSTVSAIWNAAYDLGMAIGALGAGLVVSTLGFPPAFLLTAAAMLPALLMARREGRPGRRAVTHRSDRQPDPSTGAGPDLCPEPAHS